MQRVVVTGVGVICPLGHNVATSWKGLIAGESGARAVFRELPGFESFVAAPIPDQLPPVRDYTSTRQRNIPDFAKYALLAADEAIASAGLSFRSEKSRESCGVSIGSGMGSLVDAYDNSRSFPRVSPFFVPKLLSNMAAGHVSIKYGLRGPNLSAATACAAGAHAIGEAYRIVERRDAEIMIAGGSEACLTPLAAAGFRYGHCQRRSRTGRPRRRVHSTVTGMDL